MQWVKPSRLKIWRLALILLGLIGLFAMLEFSEFFGDRQNGGLSATVAELKLPDSARVERFDFEQKGIVGDQRDGLILCLSRRMAPAQLFHRGIVVVDVPYHLHD